VLLKMSFSVLICLSSEKKKLKSYFKCLLNDNIGKEWLLFADLACECDDLKSSIVANFAYYSFVSTYYSRTLQLDHIN